MNQLFERPGMASNIGQPYGEILTDLDVDRIFNDIRLTIDEKFAAGGYEIPNIVEDLGKGSKQFSGTDTSNQIYC
jgi:hypothetical protein